METCENVVGSAFRPKGVRSSFGEQMSEQWPSVKLSLKGENGLSCGPEIED